jgi:hypothetical protein
MSRLAASRRRTSKHACAALVATSLFCGCTLSATLVPPPAASRPAPRPPASATEPSGRRALYSELARVEARLLGEAGGCRDREQAERGRAQRDALYRRRLSLTVALRATPAAARAREATDAEALAEADERIEHAIVRRELSGDTQRGGTTSLFDGGGGALSDLFDAHGGTAATGAAPHSPPRRPAPSGYEWKQDPFGGPGVLVPKVTAALDKPKPPPPAQPVPVDPAAPGAAHVVGGVDPSDELERLLAGQLGSLTRCLPADLRDGPVWITIHAQQLADGRVRVADVTGDVTLPPASRECVWAIVSAVRTAPLGAGAGRVFEIPLLLGGR